MSDYLSNAHDALARARESTDDDTVREQVDSLAEGLEELAGGDKTQESDPARETDRLKQIEKKVMGLFEETDAETTRHLHEARDEIDTFRQEYGDWDHDQNNGDEQRRD